MKRRTELDWARAAAMLGVVLLHAASGFVSRTSRLTLLGITPALFCNQCVRFAVPLFFLLSGVSLGLGGKPLRVGSFWLKRLKKLGIPYVLWTLFYFLLERSFRLSCLADPETLRQLGRDLLLGGAASHLWFVPVLLQLYLLYPLLERLQKRFPLPVLALSLALTALCTLILYLPLPWTGWWRPQLWRMFPTWIFYFVLGLYLRPERLEKLETACRRYAPLFLLLGLAAALAYSWDSLRCGDLDSIKPQLFLYTPICLAALLAAWRYLEKLPGAEKAVSRLSARSMTVYFAHVFFLRLLRRSPLLTGNILGMLGLFLLSLLLSLALAEVLALGGKLLSSRRRIPA
jgi:surface polysaccharide O-acyltransferase-like enzyme